MRFLPRAVPALALIFLFACKGSSTTPSTLPAAPLIKSFLADKSRLSFGDSATLTFAAENATSVELVDQNGQAIALSGTASSGSASVTPQTSAFYVLRAVGEGGRDSAFVQIAVDEDLKEIFLVAVPPRIESGQTAQLLWSAVHARQAVINPAPGEPTQLDAARGSGVIEVNPARTTAYSLVGTSSAGELSATVELKVTPVVRSFEAVPAAAKAGETITLRWMSAGAGEVILSEDTFGPLFNANHPENTAGVDDGNFQWTVPAMMPDGTPVREGQPLRFTLTVKQENPSITLTRAIESFVGEGPSISEFLAPESVTEGKTVQLSWRTLNAARVQVRVDGAPVFESLPGDQAQVAKGKLSLNAPAAQSTYEVIAWGHEGTKASAQKQVRVVKAPSIGSFTMPASGGNPGSAEWTTQNATSVSIRVKNGPVVFTTSTSAAVAQGSASLLPGSRTVFVLEAWNDAGDRATAEKTVEATTAGVFTASPSPVTPGEQITLTWALTDPTVAKVIGDPDSEPVKTNSVPSFVPLENASAAQVLSFPDPLEGVSAIPMVIPFRFPFLDRVMEKFYVSLNGFVAFDPTDALSQNQDIGSASSTLPAMIAAFWDELNPGQNGKVLYMVEGNSFPRRLIVEWNKFHTSDPQSELTFQVQLFETGEFRLVYKTLTGADSAGESATLGWRANATSSKTFSRDEARVGTDQEISFFSDGASAGHFDVVPAKHGAYTLFAKMGNGSHVIYPANVNLIRPGSVFISEVMAAPASGSADERWVELTNVSPEPVDISGTQLVSNTTPSSFTLPEGTVLAPGELLVLGQSLDSFVNGGAQVDVEWSGFTLNGASRDTVSLTAVGNISSFSFDATELVTGASILAHRRAIEADGNYKYCPARTVTYGPNGAFGTPGSRNEACFDYEVFPIAENLEDISGFGKPLFGDQDFVFTQMDLSTAPFPWFGASRTSLWVHTNGHVAFTQPGGYLAQNPVTPAAADPFGHLAIFWDDLTVGAANGQVYSAHLPASGNLPGRWVIQWKHVSHAWAGNDLNFEIKLFDDGVVEYHYAIMKEGPWGTFADGSDATVWMAAADFSYAFPLCQNEPVVRPNTAYRFAPVP